MPPGQHLWPALFTRSWAKVPRSTFTAERYRNWAILISVRVKDRGKVGCWDRLDLHVHKLKAHMSLTSRPSTTVLTEEDLIQARMLLEAQRVCEHGDRVNPSSQLNRD